MSMTTQTELGPTLRQARLDAGLTIDDVMVQARRLPRPLRFSRAKLSRIEANATEGTVDPYLVQFLATLYGQPVRAISPAAADQLDEFVALLDQGFDESLCIVSGEPVAA